MSILSRKKPVLGLLTVLAIGAAVLLGPDADLSATNTRVQDLEALCNSRIGLNRKVMAIEKLRGIDNNHSRNALKRLADSTDLRTATVAMAAIGREDFNGGKAKLKAIFEATGRKNPARAAAMMAWCCAKEEDGASEEDIEGYLDDEADGNDDLEAAVAATKSRVWNSGGGN